MRPKEYAVSSSDIFLCFLELCIRMQTSTSWMICSAQWMQKSAGICLNSEFAPVSYDLCLPGTCRERSGKGAQEILQEILQERLLQESLGNPLCFSLLCPGVPPSPLFPPQKIHRREVLHYDEIRTGTYRRCFQCVEKTGVRALGSQGQMADFPMTFS